jgi:cyclophilin family peptidyl-prolyl cis-trans isomerase
MKKFLILLLLVLPLVLFGCGADKETAESVVPAGDTGIALQTQSSQEPINQDNISENPDQSVSSDMNINNKTSNMPEMIIDQNKTYTAIMRTTAGDITISLNAKATPITVNNFIWLSKKDFYKGVIFHRVIKDFMVQGGDPTGTGSGGPGYQFNDESFTGEYTRGTLAMANAGPNTNGSQFFIMHADVPLPKNYVIFGQVTKGLETVDKIATAKTTIGGDGAMSKPIEPVKITSIEIIEE